MTDFLTSSGAEVTIRIKVQPRASKNEIVGLQGDELKVRLTSPPVDGAANESCREFFAAFLGVAKNQILVQGEKSRHKRLLIRSCDAEAIRDRLVRWLQG